MTFTTFLDTKFAAEERLRRVTHIDLGWDKVFYRSGDLDYRRKAKQSLDAY
jgi:hypothetical protein